MTKTASVANMNVNVASVTDGTSPLAAKRLAPPTIQIHAARDVSDVSGVNGVNSTQRGVRFCNSTLVVDEQRGQKRDAPMGLFRRAKSTKSSAARRANATAVAETTPMLHAAQPALSLSLPRVAMDDEPAQQDHSDVFVCRRDGIESERDALHLDRDLDQDMDSGRESAVIASQAASANPGATKSVTLYVYGWHNVEPGPLSWAFPSLRTALDAVRTMRNAVQWCIVAGGEWSSMDAARSSGAVLIEQLG